MKRFKQAICSLLLPAILLACLVIPASAFAASGLGNDNHTDTDDYCLRAHDVSVGLSEFTSKSRTQLESDIIAASAFTFYYRSDWNTVTSGYSVDFSALTDAVSSVGYPVVVTLDPISMSSSSYITFRVFVVDDTPASYDVSYSFESGTSGLTLPSGVQSLLPSGSTAVSGSTVTPSADFSGVIEGAGKWTFSGWSPASVTIDSSDVSFTGTWVWTAFPVYTVEYRFVSDSSKYSLPQSVLAKLPASTSGIAGDVFSAPNMSSVSASGGIWRFSGWDTHTQTINNADVVFTGTWHWHAYTSGSSSATPSPSPVGSPAATQTPEPTQSAEPLSTETQEISAASIQVLEQVNDSVPPPTAAAAAPDNSISPVQAAVAAALAALVATQSFAVASDLKILKWYQAKKAARRVRS